MNQPPLTHCTPSFQVLVTWGSYEWAIQKITHGAAVIETPLLSCLGDQTHCAIANCRLFIWRISSYFILLVRLKDLANEQGFLPSSHTIVIATRDKLNLQVFPLTSFQRCRYAVLLERVVQTRATLSRVSHDRFPPGQALLLTFARYFLWWRTCLLFLGWHPGARGRPIYIRRGAKHAWVSGVPPTGPVTERDGSAGGMMVAASPPPVEFLVMTSEYEGSRQKPNHWLEVSWHQSAWQSLLG